MTAGAAATPLGTQMLLFRQSGELFALEISAALEVLEMPALDPMPDMTAGMLGVFAVRGTFVPVYAPESALGVPPAASHAAVLLLRRGGRPMGIALEDVEDVITVDRSRLHQPLTAAGAAGVLLGVERRGTDLIGVVDAAALADACARSPMGEQE